MVRHGEDVSNGKVLRVTGALIHLGVLQLVGAAQLGQAHFSCCKTGQMAGLSSGVLLLGRYQRAEGAAHASAEQNLPLFAGLALVGVRGDGIAPRARKRGCVMLETDLVLQPRV